MAVVYRGDAFAVGNRTGSGSSIYRSHAGYQASYTLDFFDTAGNLLATDTSGYIFTGPNFACVFLTQPRQSYGYRQIATGTLSATRTIRFTAAMTDRLSVCYNSGITTATFKNGFDNLWLVVGYLGSPSAGFKAGSAPDRPVENPPEF